MEVRAATDGASAQRQGRAANISALMVAPTLLWHIVDALRSLSMTLRNARKSAPGRLRVRIPHPHRGWHHRKKRRPALDDLTRPCCVKIISARLDLRFGHGVVSKRIYKSSPPPHPFSNSSTPAFLVRSLGTRPVMSRGTSKPHGGSRGLNENTSRHLII